MDPKKKGGEISLYKKGAISKKEFLRITYKHLAAKMLTILTKTTLIRLRYLSNLTKTNLN